MGCDVTSVPDPSLSIMLNMEAINVSQDPLGVQGRRLSAKNGAEVWGGPLADGSAAVVLLNTARAEQTITVTWAQLDFGAGQAAAVRDLNRHVDLGSRVGAFSAKVRPHAAVFVRIRP